MPTPGSFTRELAALMGVAEKTVALYDRTLRTAGLRVKSGRGRGASAVTVRDAAHLLISILGSEAVKDAADAVLRYDATRPQQPGSGTDLYGETGIHELKALPREHSFVDAVEALVASAAKGSLADAVEASQTAPVIDIAALSPGTVGDIRLAGLPSGITVNVRYLKPVPSEKRKGSQPGVQRDLEQYRRISERTVFGIGAILAGEKETP